MRKEGKFKEIVALAAPVVISKLSFTAMGMVDTAMVGRLGAVEQAAVGIATTYMFTLYVFGLGILGVINTLVSQHHGAGQPRMCGVVLGHGLRVSTVIGAVTLAILLLSEPLFLWSGLSPEVAKTGYSYMFFRVLGLPAVFWYWAYNSFMEGLGETQTPMRISLAANVVNMALDYVFIFGLGPIPALGADGAGIATAFSNAFMLGCFVWVIHRSKSPFKKHGIDAMWIKTRWDLVRKMFRVGLPMGVQFFVEVGAFLVISVMIGWVSDESLAANQVALRLLSFSFMTAWGISVAATTLVGRHQGEGRPDLAYGAGMRAVGLMLIFSVACGVLFASVPRLLVGIFTPIAEVAALATGLMYVASVLQVFDGVNMVSYGALRGAGDTRWPLIAVGVMNWLVGVPLVYALTIPAKKGVLGAWIGILVMIAGQAAALFLRFRAGKWKSIRLVEPAAAESAE